LLSCEDNCAGLWHGSAIIFQSFLMEVSVHLSLITFWLYCYTHYPHDSCSHLFLGLSLFLFLGDDGGSTSKSQCQLDFYLCHYCQPLARDPTKAIKPICAFRV